MNYEEDNYNVGLPIFIIHGAPSRPTSRGRSDCTRRSHTRGLSQSRVGAERARTCPSCTRRAGNHDEPAGADNLSAIDILAACNLVNYYGKTVSFASRRFGARKGPDASLPAL